MEKKEEKKRHIKGNLRENQGENGTDCKVDNKIGEEVTYEPGKIIKPLFHSHYKHNLSDFFFFLV